MSSCYQDLKNRLLSSRKRLRTCGSVTIEEHEDAIARWLVVMIRMPPRPSVSITVSDEHNINVFVNDDSRRLRGRRIAQIDYAAVIPNGQRVIEAILRTVQESRSEQFMVDKVSAQRALEEIWKDATMRIGNHRPSR